MASSWWEIQIGTVPAAEELLFWRLQEFGCRGMASELRGNSFTVKAYLPQIKSQQLDLAALALMLKQDLLCVELPAPIVQWHLIDEEDWSSSWKDHWQPEPIGDRFLINPAWLPLPETDRLIIKLDPGVAFGTGAHATTQLCLEALEMRLDNPPAGTIVADIGCGSGILSVGAILLGAATAYAVDTDILAVDATKSNVELNQLPPDRLIVEEGSLDHLKEMLSAPVDGFVCNILAEVILQLIPSFSDIAKQETWGILSGILIDQVTPIVDRLEEHGWTMATLWRRQDWCCLNIRRA